MNCLQSLIMSLFFIRQMFNSTIEISSLPEVALLFEGLNVAQLRYGLNKV